MNQAIFQTNFTPLAAMIGGGLIGLASVLLMATLGRIAGITGIVGGLLPPVRSGDVGWRVAFIAGLAAAPLLVQIATGAPPLFQSVLSLPMLVVSGLLVGIGVTLGSGCTSGHGVCGLARLAPRSLVAVPVFLGMAVATTYVLRHGLGG